MPDTCYLKKLSEICKFRKACSQFSLDICCWFWSSGHLETFQLKNYTYWLYFHQVRGSLQKAKILTNSLFSELDLEGFELDMFIIIDFIVMARNSAKLQVFATLVYHNATFLFLHSLLLHFIIYFKYTIGSQNLKQTDFPYIRCRLGSDSNFDL